jgi:hypothetical protein
LIIKRLLNLIVLTEYEVHSLKLYTKILTCNPSIHYSVCKVTIFLRFVQELHHITVYKHHIFGKIKKATICMSAQPLPIGAFGMGIDVTKIILLPWKPLWWKKYDFKVRFNIIKYKYVKEFYFCVIFLLKSLCYQWLFVSLQRQSSPSLLTMLKSCESFFVYTHLNMANLIPFTKRFESSENLINLLESRGLQICDRNKAIQYLDNIGYYRLSAYMYPLLKMPKTALKNRR